MVWCVVICRRRKDGLTVMVTDRTAAAAGVIGVGQSLTDSGRTKKKIAEYTKDTIPIRYTVRSRSQYIYTSTGTASGANNR